MTPYEELLQVLGSQLGESLKPDNNQCCRLDFGDGIAVQIDLDSSYEKVLMGSTLGQLTAGAYREKILKQALRTNGLLRTPKGILAFSEKNDQLILFQYFPLPFPELDKFYPLLLQFADHARIWIEALKNQNVPNIEEEIQEKSGFMGLQ